MEAVEYEKSGTAGALFRGNAFEKPPQISSLPYDVRQVWLTSANPLGEKGSDRHEFLWLGNRTTRGKVEGFSAASYRCPQILRVPSYDSMSPLSHVIAATEGCGERPGVELQRSMSKFFNRLSANLQINHHAHRGETSRRSKVNISLMQADKVGSVATCMRPFRFPVPSPEKIKTKPSEIKVRRSNGIS